MIKNTASQKWIVFAFDTTDNTPKTGDATNITANLRIDGAGADAVDDTNPSELEDGFYIFDLAQGETNGNLIVICPASSTGNIQVIGCPAAVWTTEVMRGTDSVVLTGPTVAQMNTAHGLLATPAQVNTEVDNALNTTIPGSPQSNSINERIKTLDDHDLVTKIPGVVTAVGPTLTQMNTAHGLLTTPAQVATALTNYDAPTVTEMNTAHALLATPAQVNAQVLDVLNTDTFGESGSVPAATASLIDKIKWLCTLARNKLTQTVTTTTLYADDGITPIATSTVSDDGTTFTRGELT